MNRIDRVTAILIQLQSKKVVKAQSSWDKADMIRISLSQVIHHRAQLGVYLRLLDIPIPGSYGPSADDTNF